MSRVARGRPTEGPGRPTVVPPGPRWTAIVLAALALGACMPAPSPGEPAPGAGPEGDLVAPGYGSLRQEDITLTLRVGGTQVRVTPLYESVIRLTAPDTWERLSAVRSRVGVAGSVFLVAVQTDDPGGAAFDPRDLQILARGAVQRASDIVGLTPGWGGPLRQRTPEQALYVFSSTVDADMEFVVQVGNVRSASWADRLPRLESERARVRARGGRSSADSRAVTPPGRTS